MLPAKPVRTLVQRRKTPADAGYERLRGEINRLRDRFLAVPAQFGPTERPRAATIARGEARSTAA